MRLTVHGLIAGIAAVGLVVALPATASAYPTYFTTNCAGCHNDDTATCNGCHHHGARNLTVVPDKVQYKCGESLAVTLSGGNEYGWVRAILYNQDGVEVARSTGPTQSGDDSGTETFGFPVALVASAPVGIGVYTWEAAWWGSPFDSGNRTAYPHGPEIRVPVEINVVGPSPVEDSTWSRIKRLFR